MQDRPQSAAEELANSVSHGLGFVLALASAPILIVVTAQRGSAANIVGACVFAATMVLLYLSSTLYHAASPARPGAKRLLAWPAGPTGYTLIGHLPAEQLRQVAGSTR